ncbi:hypothetical protein NORO109296_20915 [Nocardiopsis rhodophaea]
MPERLPVRGHDRIGACSKRRGGAVGAPFMSEVGDPRVVEWQGESEAHQKSWTMQADSTVARRRAYPTRTPAAPRRKRWRRRGHLVEEGLLTGGRYSRVGDPRAPGGPARRVISHVSGHRGSTRPAVGGITGLDAARAARPQRPRGPLPSSERRDSIGKAVVAPSVPHRNRHRLLGSTGSCGRTRPGPVVELAGARSAHRRRRRRASHVGRRRRAHRIAGQRPPVRGGRHQRRHHRVASGTAVVGPEPSKQLKQQARECFPRGNRRDQPGT